MASTGGCWRRRRAAVEHGIGAKIGARRDFAAELPGIGKSSDYPRVIGGQPRSQALPRVGNNGPKWL